MVYGWAEGSGGDATKDRSRGKFQNGNGPGLWNREHVFPRSRAVPVLTVQLPGPGTDFHNLRPCDVETNTLRSNLKFVAGSGNSGIVGEGWYPGDEWKGDVARMVMYMYLRYNGNGSSVEQTRCLPTATAMGSTTSIDPNMVEVLLQWNAEDPVSDIELARNDLSEIHQSNRNPFIDNPVLATLIWGGPEAEDTWGLLGETVDPSTFQFELDALILSNGVLLTWNTLPNSAACQVRGGPLGGNDPVSQNLIGNEVGSFFVPQGQLKVGNSYQWRVRCALQTSPPDGVTPFSDYHTFTYSP